MCLLKKARVEASSKVWYRQLREFLVILGIVQGYGDPSLFILSAEQPKEFKVFLFVYVDIMVVTGSDEEQVEMVITKSGNKFVV